MSISRSFTTLVLVLSVAFRSYGYEVDTHEVLTEAAADRSVLQIDRQVLKDLGLDKDIRDRTQQFPNSANSPRTVLGLLRDGANFEDDLFSTVRVLRHFYNPITGQGLSTLVLPAQTPSPDWALAPRGSDSNQQFSYWDARQYLFDALTKASEAERRNAFGRTFQALGQIVHHLQDMAVPEHVRNDPHCPVSVICSPPLYEKWTDQIQVRNSLPLDSGPGGQAQGYEAQNIVQPPFASTFNSPRRFWHTEPPGPNSATSGRGIAEFTNRNFVSRGTNFSSSSFAFLPNSNFPLPVPTSTPASVERVPIGSLMPGTALQGEVWFVASEVQDNLTGRTVTNPRASTFSVFDEDLRRLAPSFGRAFTLNQFNFRAAHEFLIPRAVAYSAGMINYFFRGKIDLVPDPNSAGQHLIRNLGSEPMKGKFRLYYDDQDGNRNQVLDAGGQALVWDTDVILAAAEGVLAAGASLQVPGFVPPSSPPPKTPGEYMLVFSGDMGEERAEAGGVGAVVGKQIRNEYKGALYVLGMDANGVLTSFRADKDGTKVLSGWDISKRDANNPNGVLVALGVFNPLGSLYGSSITKPVRDKIYAYKQVEYGPGPIEYAATSVTLIGLDTLPVFRSHYGAGLGRTSFGQVVWIARSPDKQLGTFEFQILNIRNEGRDADVQFTRRFEDASGVSRVAVGGIAMPTLPSPFSYQQINGFREPLNNSFPLVISDDGLTIKGFATTGQLNSRIHTRIVFSLAQTPQARLEQTTYTPTVSGSDFFPTPPVQPASSCSVDVRRAPDGAPFTITANGFVRKGGNDFESSLKEEVPIGNLAGRIVSYVREGLVKQTVTIDESFCYAEGSDFDPATGLQRRKYSIRNTANNGLQFSGGTFERLAGGDYSLPSPNVPKVTISVGPLKGEYPGGQLFCYGCQWSQFYEGFDPVPPAQFVLNPGLAFRRDSVGRKVIRALTDRHADAIYEESASDTQAFIKKFRSIVLTGKEYVADSSPLGEVFFATSDKSVIIHEPVPGGMPQVQIPENVVKLLAAIWM